MPTYIILGMTYAFAAAVQPGPLQAYLVSQALSHGWRRTLPAALSPLISDGPIIALVLLALSRLPPWLIPTVRLAGGVLLLYLAFAAARTWKAQGSGQAAQKRAEPRSLLGATAVNLMNPGPYLGWSLIMGPLLLKGWREAPAHGVALLASFYSVMVLSLAGLGFAVDLGKADFVGRDGVCRKQDEGLSRRLVQFRLEDPEPLLYHNEPILRDGEIVGRLTSGGYGHHLGASVGLGYVPCVGQTAEQVLASTYTIDVAGTQVGATASLRPLYDPRSERVRS